MRTQKVFDTSRVLVIDCFRRMILLPFEPLFPPRPFDTSGLSAGELSADTPPPLHVPQRPIAPVLIPLFMTSANTSVVASG